MDKHAFQSQLGKLMSEISILPEAERQKIENLASTQTNHQKKLRQTVTDLQESLDYLRLSIKYLMFDLEATRRENDYLRGMLEEEMREDESDGECI